MIPRASHVSIHFLGAEVSTPVKMMTSVGDYPMLKISA